MLAKVTTHHDRNRKPMPFIFLELNPFLKKGDPVAIYFKYKRNGIEICIAKQVGSRVHLTIENRYLKARALCGENEVPDFDRMYYHIIIYLDRI